MDDDGVIEALKHRARRPGRHRVKDLRGLSPARVQEVRDVVAATDGYHPLRFALAALDEGTEPGPLPLPPPCSPAQVDAAEARLGFALPTLLRRVYTEVADGGIGPGVGIVGIAGQRDQGLHLVELYESFRDAAVPRPEAAWPVGLLPLVDTGCAIYQCVDATDPEHPMVTFDPNLEQDPGDPIDRLLSATGTTLERWL
jgi:hypothetical protein